MRTTPSRLIYATLMLPFRRLFAKAGYNIALISRESESLHKFAAELKSIGDTDVRDIRVFSAISPLTPLFSSLTHV